MNPIRFAAALSTRHDGAVALREAAETLNEGLAGRNPDLLLAFTSHHHGSEFGTFASRLGDLTGARILLGCGAESVIGGKSEIEREPALALWGVSGEEIEVAPFRLNATAGPEGPEYEGEPDLSEISPENRSLLLLGDPFSFPMAAYLESLNDRIPGLPAVGGMASGGAGSGANSLFFGDQRFSDGAIGVLLGGNIELQPVVSQAYRPVGETLVITDCDGSLIKKLGGKPAPAAMMQTLEGLPMKDRDLLQQGPFLGIAWDANKSVFDPADFLAHPIRGIAPQEEAVVIVGRARRGQTVQFMLRDPEMAGENLTRQLAAGTTGPPEEAHEAGALIFSCNGRGSRMFSEPDHDISRVQENLGAEIPTAGFFAMGEIGPVRGRNYLHGFTASVAVYRAATGR
jgi:small ligand-binding sensory domain FIST